MIDTCSNRADFAFTGIASPEPDTSLVRGSDADPIVEGSFAVTFAVEGSGSTRSTPKEDFFARYEAEEGAVTWTWQETGSCEREGESGLETIAASDAMDCARSAFSELGLDFVDIGSPEDPRVSLQPETLAYVSGTDEQRTIDGRPLERYEPFSVWQYGDGLIEAGPEGHVRWVTTWSDGIQWTLVLFP